MAKKKKEKRIRTFKVSADYGGIPFIRFGGKYLSCELGLNGGDRLEVTRKDDCVILRKFSVEELALYEAERKEKALLQELRKISKPKHTLFTPLPRPSLMVAEKRSTYSVEDEINKRPEKYNNQL